LLTYCETIIRDARPGRRLVIVGACLTGSGGRHDRGLDVHVTSPEVAPLAKILGEELGRFIHSVHEDKGVTFDLGAERDRFRQRACFLGRRRSARRFRVMRTKE
jgi:apoptosis-inducing factor 3